MPGVTRHCLVLVCVSSWPTASCSPAFRLGPCLHGTESAGACAHARRPFRCTVACTHGRTTSAAGLRPCALSARPPTRGHPTRAARARLCRRGRCSCPETDPGPRLNCYPRSYRSYRSGDVHMPSRRIPALASAPARRGSWPVRRRGGAARVCASRPLLEQTASTSIASIELRRNSSCGATLVAAKL